MINEISISDKDYPEELKKINNAPKKLFYVGDKNALKKKCIAIVGTRKASILGMHAAYNLGYNLAKRGYTIVSGLARWNRYICSYWSISFRWLYNCCNWIWA